VIDAALRYCNLPKGTENSLQELKDHLKNIPKDKADQAVGRITRQMGYNNYLERNKMNEGKIAILRSLSYQENSPKGLLDRLEALQLLLKDKDNDPTCKFVLSTIHSSKGLEYDTVYLMDVMDGVFPQEVPDIAWKSSSLRKSASGDDLQELETFEEERRLFYVGITRAKNALYLFEYKNEDTTFINELLDRGIDPDKRSKAGSSGAFSGGNSYKDSAYGSNYSDGLYGGSRASGNFAPKVKLYGGRDFTGKKSYKEH
jgi:DNA helicase-2/ATP-dependent DNA helicase PcrA